MTNKSHPFSLIMLIMHRRVKRADIPAFLESDMYTRLMAEMLDSGQACHGEVWILGDREEELTFRRVKVRLHPDYKTVEHPPTDVLFVRGDHWCYVPLLRKSLARRFLFYPASGRGIPRRWRHFHGILMDDKLQEPILRKFYPGAYLGVFLKTAVPEIFHPLPEEKKIYDVCLVGDLVTARKNLNSIAQAVTALPQVKFVICGKNIDPHLQRRLGARSGQFTCLGFIPRTELNKVYNRSKLGVLTSNKSDASPRVILEFMAAGLPILANEQISGIDKFLLPHAGRTAATSDFVTLIPRMLNASHQYNPYEVFMNNFSPAQAAADFARHVHAVLQMPETPPPPSWRGKLARLLRPRIDQYEYVTERNND